MTVWNNTKLYDRGLQLLTQREKGYVKFNAARDNIIALMRPDLGSDTTADGDGSFFGEDIYDGVGPWAVGVMARGFQGGLVSADADWFSHDMGNSQLDDIKELSVWLQEIDDHMTGQYQKSNFYRVLPNFTKDGVSIGSPLMFIEETDVVKGEITFKPQHYKTVFLFYNGKNEQEGVIIKDKTWTVKKIVDEFAPTKEEQSKLPKAIKDDLENGNLYTEHTIYRFVFKSSNPVWDIDGFKKPDGEWISVYFADKTTEEQKNEPLKTEKYFSKPFVVWDYDKKPWESVSRTPAFEAIHDVHSQQELGLDQVTNRKLKNSPPMAVLDDHRNIVDFNPQGITAVAKEDWANLPTAIDVVGDIRLSREEMEFNAEKVKRWFFTDQFIKFTDLTSTLRQQPTATQIIKISAELATQVNPGIASYTTGALADIDARVLDIELRAGRGPFRPERMEQISDVIASILEESDSFEILPVFTGQLARAQKVKQELDPILEGMGMVGEMAAVWPNITNIINEHGTASRALKIIGFPLTEVKSEDEYNEVLQAMADAAAQAQQQQMMLEAAKISPAVSGPVDESSILAKVGEAAG